jgi:hypothetical protein
MPEQDVDVPIELRLQTDCAICGHHDEFGTIAISLAWYREDSAPKAVARCLDVEACRTRVAGRWPLLERGESPSPVEKSLEAPHPPGTALHHPAGSDGFKTSGREVPTGPMQPPETTQPDGQEAERDDWI